MTDNLDFSIGKISTEYQPGLPERQVLEIFGYSKGRTEPMTLEEYKEKVVVIDIDRAEFFGITMVGFK